MSKKVVWNICKKCGRDYRECHKSKVEHLKSHGISILAKNGGGNEQGRSYFTRLEYLTMLNE